MSLKLRNIIAMEDGEYEDVAPEVAEGAVDEVEAVEAADEITEDADAVDDFNNELDETVEDVQELEATEETLGAALEDPEYEGLDEVSAEMIGQRLRNLSKRRGFDVDRLEGVFSKESFNSRTSGRRRKTEIALEGIRDAIVAMWERIKAAVKAVWQAIKDFWKKHISTLGRLLKALEKTKKRARDVNGSPDSSKEIKPSGSLQRAFYAPNSGPITTSLIKTYGDRQKEALNFGMKWMSEMVQASKSSAEAAKAAIDELKKLSGLAPGQLKRMGGDAGNLSTLSEDDAKGATFTKSNVGGPIVNPVNSLPVVVKNKDTFVQAMTTMVSEFEKGELGTEEAPLTNGWFIVFDKDPLSEENPVLEFKWDQREVKPSDKRQFQVGNKNEMVNVLDEAIKLIKETQRLGGNFDKVSRDFDKVSNDVSRAVNNVTADMENSDLRKLLNASLRIFNECAKLIPKINTKIVGLNATYAKQLISFCNTSISNYKEY